MGLIKAGDRQVSFDAASSRQGLIGDCARSARGNLSGLHFLIGIAPKGQGVGLACRQSRELGSDRGWDRGEEACCGERRDGESGVVCQVHERARVARELGGDGYDTSRGVAGGARDVLDVGSGACRYGGRHRGDYRAIDLNCDRHRCACRRVVEDGRVHVCGAQVAYVWQTPHPRKDDGSWWRR